MVGALRNAVNAGRVAAASVGDMSEMPPPDFPEDMPPKDFMPVPPNAGVYVQVAFWVAQHVRQQATRSEYSESELIEQFAMNVRKINNPEWKPDA